MASDKDSKSSGGPGESMARAQPYMDAAYQLIAGIGVGAGGGYWLDRHFHTSPWLLIVGLFLGFAAGFLALYRTVQKLDKGIGRTQPGPKDRP